MYIYYVQIAYRVFSILCRKEKNIVQATTHNHTFMVITIIIVIIMLWKENERKKKKRNASSVAVFLSSRVMYVC